MNCFVYVAQSRSVMAVAYKNGRLPLVPVVAATWQWQGEMWTWMHVSVAAVFICMCQKTLNTACLLRQSEH